MWMKRHPKAGARIDVALYTTPSWGKQAHAPWPLCPAYDFKGRPESSTSWPLNPPWAGSKSPSSSSSSLVCRCTEASPLAGSKLSLRPRRRSAGRCGSRC